MNANTNNQIPSALSANHSGQSAPNVHHPEHLEPTNTKHPDHPVYHDVATYCSYVLPQCLGWSYDCMLITIQTAQDPDMRCRELLLIAKTWKDMAPRLNQDGQDSLVDLLFRISELPEELGFVQLGNLRRIFRNFDPGMPQSASFTDLPTYLRGPDEDDLEFEASRFTEPGLSLLIIRCEALAGYEDALFDMWTSDGFYGATFWYEWNHVGSGPIDPALWRMPDTLWDQLRNLRHD